MVAELISVGTELLLGNIVNTNATYLAGKCAELGLSVYHMSSVGDNEERLMEAITTAIRRSDIIILSGGLGPTQDDLTKEVTAKVVSASLVEDAHTRERIEEYFNRSVYKKIPENNWKQALVIQGAKVIDNNNGTAPGLIVTTNDNKKIILLPGPPNELIPMFEEDIVPYIKELCPEVIYSKMVKISGMGESQVAMKIADLIETQTNPTIAPYAKAGEVHLRVTAKADSVEEAKELVKPIVRKIKKRLKDNVYTVKEAVNLEDACVQLLTKAKLKLATAESCTGGLLAGRLINVPGASKVLKEGFVTYSNKAKRTRLNVKKETLKKYGAVSEETAREMAKGLATNTGADVAISITGIAGPDGGTIEKPVGLVYIGCYINGEVFVKKFQFKGNRQKVREYAVVYGLDMLRRCILSI